MSSLHLRSWIDPNAMIVIPSSELQNYPEVPRNLQAVRSLAYQGISVLHLPRRKLSRVSEMNDLLLIFMTD